MKCTRFTAVAALFLATLFTTTLTTSAAAQTAATGNFVLTEQVNWGKAVLPAGSYTIFVETSARPILAIIRSADRKTVALVSTTLTDQVETKRAFLFVAGQGTQRRVESMTLPQFGLSLRYEHMTDAEREEFAKAAAAAPVVSSFVTDIVQPAPSPSEEWASR